MPSSTALLPSCTHVQEHGAVVGYLGLEMRVELSQVLLPPYVPDLELAGDSDIGTVETDHGLFGPGPVEIVCGSFPVTVIGKEEADGSGAVFHFLGPDFFPLFVREAVGLF